TKYSDKKKAYKKYKIGIALTITGSLIGITVTAGVGVATGAFTGGATTAFTAIGLIKAIIILVKEIASAIMEGEQAAQALKAQLGVVEKAAKNLLARKLNEYSAAVVQEFLGISQPTVKNCKAQLDTVKNKLTGLEQRVHEASKKLNGLLDTQVKLRSKF